MADIKLSRRMQTVADMVKASSVADIGCDHAFVSIYLIQSGRADKVIAMDVRKGPLKIARDNVQFFGLEECIDVRISDGFEALGINEADCAVIAGMGGPLMVDIMRAGKCHTDNGIRLVLQPQSEIHKVREYLLGIGYEITREDMLMEDGKYYTVIQAGPSCRAGCEYSIPELMYGKYLLIERNETLRIYLLHCRTKNIELIDRLKYIHTEKSDVRISELQRENAIIETALEYFVC